MSPPLEEKKLERKAQKCFKCGADIVEGYIFPDGTYGGLLMWSNDDPTRNNRPPGVDDWVTLLTRSVVHDKKDWLRKATWCPKCNTMTFVHEPQD